MDSNTIRFTKCTTSPQCTRYILNQYTAPKCVVPALKKIPGSRPGRALLVSDWSILIFGTNIVNFHCCAAVSPFIDHSVGLRALQHSPRLTEAAVRGDSPSLLWRRSGGARSGNDCMPGRTRL
jgi:hypothetical protein